MQKKYFLLTLLLSALVLLTPRVYAQGPGFDGDVADTIPLDGGLSLLAVAGIGYGIKKLKDAREKNDTHK